MGKDVNELALFAGAGGGIWGGKLLGWRTVCAVEWNPYAASVLLARQNDETMEPFPIWDDVRTFDGAPWRGIVDVVSGGFPCQDVSIAGKGAGIDGERSGMWREMARVVREVRPRYVLVENSPMLTSRGLGRVLGDLAAMGYDAEWGVFGADDVGAPHQRERIWILAADANRVRELQPQGGVANERGRAGDGAEAVADAAADASQKRLKPAPQNRELAGGRHRQRLDRNRRVRGEDTAEVWWASEPDVVRMVHGVANGRNRVEALGNGQVPAVVRLAWTELYRRLMGQQ